MIVLGFLLTSILMNTMQHAKGTFEVKMAPQALTRADSPERGRMTFDKVWAGDLEGTSTGEMLTAMTVVKDSAGYVAVEKFTGVVAGRRGSFVMQHSATMNRGAQQLAITVVPDSGTEQLTGITGRLTIDIRDGKHYYDLEYALPTAP